MSSHTRPNDALLDTNRPRKRRKTSVACESCRSRKVRCDGDRPVCQTCANRGEADSCAYTDSHGTVSHNDQRYVESLEKRLQEYERTFAETKAAQETQTPARPLLPTDWQGNTLHDSTTPVSVCSFPLATPLRDLNTINNAVETSPLSNDQHISHVDILSNQHGADPSVPQPIPGDQPVQRYLGHSSSAYFVNKLRRAVRARHSIEAEPDSSCPSPPLMLTLTELGPNSRKIGPHDENLTLPPRQTADALMGTYWREHYPLYPALDYVMFQTAYQGIWSGMLEGSDQCMTHCILNMMFALAARSSGLTKPESPVQKQLPYITRARNLLHTDLLTGWSFQLLQALLLYAQYLQSTDEPHQCWTVVGMAVRMAESLGLHAPSTSRKLGKAVERELARRLWYCCVTFDRVVSMSLGRPPTITPFSARAVDRPSQYHISRTSNSSSADGGISGQWPNFDMFIHSLPLFDVLHQILLHFYSPDQSRTTEKELFMTKLAKIIELEETLYEWEESLPSLLRSEKLDGASNNAQVSLLKLRYSQVRMLLYRPALSVAVMKKSQRQLSPAGLPGRAAILLALSRACAQSAMEIAATLTRSTASPPTSNEMPRTAWWFSVFYSYTAATTILAARTQPNLASEIGIASLDLGLQQCKEVLEHYKATYPSASRSLAALSHIARDLQTDKPLAEIAEGDDLVLTSDPLNLPDFAPNFTEQDFMDAAWLDSVPFDFDSEQWLTA